MSSAVEPLILDLLETLAAGPRPYDDVIGAWRTSCPRLPVWEEVCDRGFVDRQGSLVALTDDGRAHLAANGRLATPQRRNAARISSRA